MDNGHMTKNHMEQVLHAGQQLGNDFKRIREHHNLTLEDLHESTLITLQLLTSFEKTALFDYTRFNHVYLRYLVRAYAQAAGITPEHALDALEEARRGRYHGRLALEYLGDSPDLSPSPKHEPEPILTFTRWFSPRHPHHNGNLNTNGTLQTDRSISNDADQ